jgi:hypothetical protein
VLLAQSGNLSDSKRATRPAAASSAGSENGAIFQTR